MWNEIFGFDANRPPTRLDAMKLPALARGRNAIVSAVCRNPLIELTGNVATPDVQQPEWMHATDIDSPVFRIAWTVDDHIFYGMSVWGRLNNEDGTIARTYRIDRSRWTIDSVGRVFIDGSTVPARADEVIVIPGLHDGILNFGTAISDARDLYAAVRSRIQNPLPNLDLHQTEGEDMTNTQIDDLIVRWAKARQGQNGAIGYTNKAIEAKVLESSSVEQLMIDGRNAAAVDLARLIGVSASVVDATAPKASLNYETTTGRNQQFVDLDLSLYTTPIEARLSMDDVVAKGRHVAFDMSAFTALAAPPTGPTLQD